MLHTGSRAFLQQSQAVCIFFELHTLYYYTMRATLKACHGLLLSWVQEKAGALIICVQESLTLSHLCLELLSRFTNMAVSQISLLSGMYVEQTKHIRGACLSAVLQKVGSPESQYQHNNSCSSAPGRPPALRLIIENYTSTQKPSSLGLGPHPAFTIGPDWSHCLCEQNT